MGKIEFNMENIKKCLCTKCAVQIESQCVKDKKKMMLLITQQDLDSPMMMGSDKVPGVYCGTGKATCRDIDTNKTCKCGECPIWEEYNLVIGEPQGYFCREGEAK
ncbi:MAG: DUF2769 domain-containing protein [Euryarchaeota archaeon]|nr:DUF2769 domain-containing protein [Euryarchaeota archaeon]